MASTTLIEKPNFITYKNTLTNEVFDIKKDIVTKHVTQDGINLYYKNGNAKYIPLVDTDFLTIDDFNTYIENILK